MAKKNSRASTFIRAFRKFPTFLGEYFWSGKGHMFYKPFAPFHRKAVQMAKDTTKHLAIVIPRGFGKTKLFSVLYVLWLIIFQKEPYIMVISYSQNKAKQILRDIDRLVKHRKFKAVFGDFKANARANGYSWTQERMIFINERLGINAILEGKGSGQQVVGASENDARPTTVVLDDLMSPKQAKSVEMTENIKEWYNTQVLPGLASEDRRGREGRVIHIGTPFEPQDFMTYIMGSGDVRVIKFPALDSNDESIWEDMFSTERLHRIRDSYIKRGALSSFLSQYQLETQSAQKIKFPAEKLIKRKETDIPQIIQKCDGVYVYVDMAYSQQTYSDFVGVTVVALSPGSKITCLEAHKGKINQDELFDLLWDIQTRYRLIKWQGIFIETRQFNLTQAFFREKGINSKRILNINPLLWVGEKGEESKVNRINTLIPYAHIGNIELVETLTYALEVEMLSYDGRKKKGLDTLDSFAYAHLFLSETTAEEEARINKPVSREHMTADQHFEMYVTNKPPPKSAEEQMREMYI